MNNNNTSSLHFFKYQEHRINPEHWLDSCPSWCWLTRGLSCQITGCRRTGGTMGRSLFPAISRDCWRFTCRLSSITPTWSRRWRETCSGIKHKEWLWLSLSYLTEPDLRTRSFLSPQSVIFAHRFINRVWLITPACISSYSIILLEIATRSDPVPVSHSLIGWPQLQLLNVTCQLCFCVRLCRCHWLNKGQVIKCPNFQAEESNLESTWCPPLPELISSKADNTCPCPADYVEVSTHHLNLTKKTNFPSHLFCCLLSCVCSRSWSGGVALTTPSTGPPSNRSRSLFTGSTRSKSARWTWWWTWWWIPLWCPASCEL